MDWWLIVLLVVWFAGWCFYFGVLMFGDALFSLVTGRKPCPVRAAAYSAFWPLLLIASIFE